jgi:hypothetical protein
LTIQRPLLHYPDRTQYWQGDLTLNVSYVWTNRYRTQYWKGDSECVYFRLIDCLFFNVPLKNISLIWRHHHTGKGLQNLGLWLVLRAFEQGGIVIVPHLLQNGASVFPVPSEGLPHSVASYDRQRYVEDLV